MPKLKTKSSAKKRFKISARGKVITAGNLTQGISDNDTIRYDKLAGHSVSWDDELYDVIRQRDVIIIE